MPDESPGPGAPARYIVRVDDNGRYRDDEARWTYGRFASCETAVAACRRIVDVCLEDALEPGITAEALYAAYETFGDDPFIIALDGAPACRFSARAYARQRAAELCGGVRR